MHIRYIWHLFLIRLSIFVYHMRLRYLQLTGMMTARQGRRVNTTTTSSHIARVNFGGLDLNGNIIMNLHRLVWAYTRLGLPRFFYGMRVISQLLQKGETQIASLPNMIPLYGARIFWCITHVWEYYNIAVRFVEKRSNAKLPMMVWSPSMTLRFLT